MTWDYDSIGILTRMWLNGHTATEIALHFKCTRNAVIGKLNKLGLLKSDKRKVWK